jgi:hypothetical protein
MRGHPLEAFLIVESTQERRERRSDVIKGDRDLIRQPMKRPGQRIETTNSIIESKGRLSS